MAPGRFNEAQTTDKEAALKKITRYVSKTHVQEMADLGFEPNYFMNCPLMVSLTFACKMNTGSVY